MSAAKAYEAVKSWARKAYAFVRKYPFASGLVVGALAVWIVV